MPLISLVPHTHAESDSSTAPEMLVLGIWISDTIIKALLLRLHAGGVELLRTSKTTHYSGVKNAVEVADAALQELGKESETINDVIFVLDNTWITAGDISPEKKPMLKKMTDELDLSPIGFVETTESIVNYAVREHARFSGIFILIAAKTVTVVVVEHASISGIEVVGRSQSVVDDCIEGMARFSQAGDDKAGYLPPQIIVTSIEEESSVVTQVQQRLLSATLEDKIKFLQPPTVTVLSESDYISRIVTEAGVAVADAKGLAVAKSKVAIPLKDQVPMVADQTDNLRPVSAEELGFTEVTKQEASPTSATEPEYAIDTPTSFGIPIPSEVHTPETSLEKTKDVVDATPVAQTSDAQTFNPERHKSKKSFFQRHHKNTRLFIGLGVGLGLLVLTAVAAWAFMFTSTAKIGIVLATKPVTKEAEISVSAKISESNVEDLVLAAQKIQKTVSGENTILTTGVKVVGETSKGTVMVYNKTTAEKEFAAGTVISAGDRDFTFDEAVTVPAATVKETSSGEEKKYGKIDAQVTATDIGADGNLAKETEMTVESFDTSTYEVIVEDDLTGGSSREVRVVSASDQTEALKELQAELETQALQELEDEVASGEYILPKLETVEKTVTFSSDVDDETNEVTASLKLTVEALTYTAASLQPLATRILASEVPEGYVLSEEAPSILSQPLNGDTDASASGTLILANLSSEAIPVVDTESLFQYVLGKSSSDAMRNLEDYEGIKSATVVFNPSFVSKVPADKERVEILVVQDE